MPHPKLRGHWLGWVVANQQNTLCIITRPPPLPPSIQPRSEPYTAARPTFGRRERVNARGPVRPFPSESLASPCAVGSEAPGRREAGWICSPCGSLNIANAGRDSFSPPMSSRVLSPALSCTAVTVLCRDCRLKQYRWDHHSYRQARERASACGRAFPSKTPLLRQGHWY